MLVSLQIVGDRFHDNVQLGGPGFRLRCFNEDCRTVQIDGRSCPYALPTDDEDEVDASIRSGEAGVRHRARDVG